MFKVVAGNRFISKECEPDFAFIRPFHPLTIRASSGCYSLQIRTVKRGRLNWRKNKEFSPNGLSGQTLSTSSTSAQLLPCLRQILKKLSEWPSFRALPYTKARSPAGAKPYPRVLNVIDGSIFL